MRVAAKIHDVIGPEGGHYIVLVPWTDAYDVQMWYRTPSGDTSSLTPRLDLRRDGAMASGAFVAGLDAAEAAELLLLSGDARDAAVMALGEIAVRTWEEVTP